MKKGLHPYLLIITCVLIFGSCKKEDTTPEIPEVPAVFSIEKPCTLTEITVDSVNYIDSVFHFKNFSDTGQLITHHWSFGDGTNSTQYSPDHAFPRSGYYSVSLVTKYDGTPRDTFTRGVHIIIGQKRLSAGKKYTWAVDVAPADGNGLFSLVRRFENFADLPEYCLVRTDSISKQQLLKVIPGTGSRLDNIERLSDGNYIAAGNYAAGNTNQFAVSKINAQGDEIWTKFIAGMTGTNEYAAGTSDGGILTIGNVAYVNPSGTTWFHSAIVKLDANGNELWRKNYNTLPESDFMSDPLNFVEVSGEYVFASLKRSFPSDSVILTRINAAGNTLQRTATGMNLPSTVFKMGIAKAANTFLVFMTNTRTAGFFNNTLGFIKFQDIAETGISDVQGKGNKFFLVEGTHQYAFTRGINEDGSPLWDQLSGSWIRLPGCSGMHHGSSRYGTAVLLTPFGDVVGMTYGQDDPSGTNSASAYLYRFTESGLVR